VAAAPASISAGSRDKNGLETGETEWCYICFYIFVSEEEVKTKTPKTNIETNIVGKQIEYGVDTERKADVHWNQEIS
jgi:hypothetical protein